MKNYEENYWAKRAGQYNKTSWVKDEDFMDAFLGMLPKQTFNSILEIGIGTGVVAEKVVNNFGPLIGIDISKEMITQINHPNITAIVGDAHKLEFDNYSFDLIYMRNVIHYIDNPDLVFSEIHRCLQSGGYFLFSQVVPPNDSLSEEYDWIVGRDIHYPTQGEIVKLFLKYSNLKRDYFILRNQSIMNWLNNTSNDKHIKEDIIIRHKATSDQYKTLVNYKMKDDDILVDIKHLIILAQKK